MKSRSIKNKGWILEKHIADKLRNTGIDKFARRNPGSGSGKWKGDIATRLPLTIECKNHKVPHIMKWMAQAERESLGYQWWSVIWHPPMVHLDSSVAIIPLDLLVHLLKRAKL